MNNKDLHEHKILLSHYQLVIKYLSFPSQLIFNRFYSGSSACDKTSLFALRNLINWRDVVTDAEKKPAPCKRFLNLFLDAQLIASGMDFFGMQNVKSRPTKNGFKESMKDSLKAVKQKYLFPTIKQFICTYIVDSGLLLKHIADVEKLQEWEDYLANQPVNPDGRYPCRFVGCQESFKHDGKCRRRHELTHNPPPMIREAPKITSQVTEDSDDQSCSEEKHFKDDVFDYHCSLMNMALLLRNFIDAGREGDGDCLVRCIKVFLLHFRQDGEGSTKYALECLYHLFQLSALLTPREAERMKWNRTVNNKGGPGNNVFMDLDLEHDNHLFKELLRGLGANVTENSVSRLCKAFSPIKSLLEKLDEEIGVRVNSSTHTKKDFHKDVMKVVQVLVEEKVFTVKREHKMTYFANCPRDYLQFIDTASMFTWINNHKKNITLSKRPR